MAKARLDTYLQRPLVGQNLSQALACTHSQCVAQDSDLLNIVHGLQASDVWLEVLSCVQLQTLALKGEDLIGGCHNFEQMRSLFSTKERMKRKQQGFCCAKCKCMSSSLGSKKCKDCTCFRVSKCLDLQGGGSVKTWRGRVTHLRRGSLAGSKQCQTSLLSRGYP